MPDVSRHDIALAALRAAVTTDNIARDEDAIARQLSPHRIAQFTADVYASRFSFAVLEQLFARARAFIYSPANADDAPPERGNNRPLQRAPFTDAPGWAPYMVHAIGPGLEDDVMNRLEELLAEAPAEEAHLDSGTEILTAIDLAISQLAPTQDVLVILAGNYRDVLVELTVTPPEHYVPGWQLRQENRELPSVEASYRGYPLLLHRAAGRRRLYVLEARAWGCLSRAQVEGGTDLRIEVESISADRARELLDGSPEFLPHEPDEGTKLRKLRASVYTRVYERVGFVVRDPARARGVMARVVPVTDAQTAGSEDSE